jgi:hypothetical protein
MFLVLQFFFRTYDHIIIDPYTFSNFFTRSTFIGHTIKM